MPPPKEGAKTTNIPAGDLMASDEVVQKNRVAAFGNVLRKLAQTSSWFCFPMEAAMWNMPAPECRLTSIAPSGIV